MSGMLLVGLVMVGFMTLSDPWFGQPNHYYVQGVGYATIMDVLRGDLTAWHFLLLLVAAKLLLTCLTLGSGASGGVFSPSMFLGATLGGAFGTLLLYFVPSVPMTPAHFAYAGMAGMVGGTTGAVLTGTIMIFEMTRDYTVIMPVIVTVAIATAVRDALSPATIYTLKLVRRGDVVPQGLLARMDDRDCRHAMSADFVAVSQAQLAEDNTTSAALRRGKVVVISGPDNRIRSILDERSRTEADEGPLALEGGTHVVVSPETPLRTVLRALGDAGGARIAVVACKTADGSQEVLGVITEREVARLSYAAARVSD